MRTIYSERHRLQDGRAELIDGKLLPSFERPLRAELIIARVREVALGEVLAPEEHGMEPLRRVHAGPFLRFLEGAWEAWLAEHGAYDALPLCWPTRASGHARGRGGRGADGRGRPPGLRHPWHLPAAPVRRPAARRRHQPDAAGRRGPGERGDRDNGLGHLALRRAAAGIPLHPNLRRELERIADELALGPLPGAADRR